MISAFDIDIIMVYNRPVENGGNTTHETTSTYRAFLFVEDMMDIEAAFDIIISALIGIAMWAGALRLIFYFAGI